MSHASLRTLRSLPAALFLLALLFGAVAVRSSHAQDKKPAAPPDVLVLSDGDILHGKFVSAIEGKVTFHTESLGDVTLSWDKIKELHTTENFGVLEKTVTGRGREAIAKVPTGAIDVNDGNLTVKAENAPASIPVKNAAFVMDEAVIRKQVLSEPGFLHGWNGSATAGATLVSATDNQYTFASALNLVRTVPVAPWLETRNKTLFGFNESYGKITQPAYSYPAVPPATGSVQVPAVITKSSITHFGVERDEYFSAKLYALGQAAFDHNFAQDLQLQQIYGGGLGWTIVKTPKQEIDLKATVQYEKQSFIPASGNVNQDLFGSTFALAYALKLKLLTYAQTLSYIPAYNQMSAYSAAETNAVSFPTYKNLSFSVGTLDTYLNDAPFQGTSANPPTKPNSFQFTMGVTYSINSKY